MYALALTGCASLFSPFVMFFLAEAISAIVRGTTKAILDSSVPSRCRARAEHKRQEAAEFDAKVRRSVEETLDRARESSRRKVEPDGLRHERAQELLQPMIDS